MRLKKKRRVRGGKKEGGPYLKEGTFPSQVTTPTSQPSWIFTSNDTLPHSRPIKSIQITCIGPGFTYGVRLSPIKIHFPSGATGVSLCCLTQSHNRSPGLLYYTIQLHSAETFPAKLVQATDRFLDCHAIPVVGGI